MAKASMIKGKAHHHIIIDDPTEVGMGRLFPEEKTAYDAARSLFLHGPQRYLKTIQGEARPWPKSAWKPEDGGRTHAERLCDKAPIIFIRDDGWTLATPRKWFKVAEGAWREQWIGYIDVVDFGAGRIISELTVFPDKGPRYVAGLLDEKGDPIDRNDLDEKNDLDEQHREHAMNRKTEPTTVEDVREWMRLGCHTE